ncbi:MAG: DNA repair protein RadA [Deltaproteobacteria bacterium]|nr:DNA repair protein RadA [Deltaproteobacteria bacterium]
MKEYYVCQECGGQTPKWMGRCPDCGQWNTLVQELKDKAPGKARLRGMTGMEEMPRPIAAISAQREDRVYTGIMEFDRVLGGGLISGTVVLIGGDPGIGKSTLILQGLNQLGLSGHRVLYISGEESARQIKIRADRLGVSSENLYVVTETCLERILGMISELKPAMLAVDSIQTIYTETLPAAPGSLIQVRETSAMLMQLSKRTGISSFLIGHVTKDGAIAGPRILEHIVDTVLYFEGSQGHTFRILRAVKNRFGSTNEIGVFEMNEAGLAEVAKPSEVFLAERPRDVAGSVVVPCIEGSRPILVEIQALVSPTGLGVPRRTTIGVDRNRVSLLVAVLEKKIGLNIAACDIYMNVAGGAKVDEPAVDLGIVAALTSSFTDRAVPADTVVFGEVGLTGEIRGVSQADVRINEARKLGFNRFFLSRNNLEKLTGESPQGVHGIKNLTDFIELLFT